LSYKFLSFHRDGAVEHITLNRPEVRNAFNAEMIGELSAWAARASADRSLRAVVVAGAGSAFCAGADVQWMARTVSYTREQNLRDASAASEMFMAMDRLPVPLIGRIQGAALGGGSGLAAVCDIVVAEEAAVFGFTETKLGILPAVISPFVLAKVGRSAARELFLTGRRFPASRAREIGLVHEIVPAGQLDAAVRAHVREVLTAGPEAIAAAKALIRAIWSRTAEEAAALTAQALAERRVSAEGQEGLKAFLEKRAPAWRGQ
jgi:methylglutaconyl-CoA hydratase